MNPMEQRTAFPGHGRRLLTGWLLATALAAVDLAASPDASAERDLARRILADAGVRGGVIAHIGCGEGRLTAALRANDRYRVHGLDTHAHHVAAARAHLHSLGLYGPVSVEIFSGSRLPYVDGFVNLVVSEDLGRVPMDEVMRVLVPHGVACLKTQGQWSRTVKPRPASIDEWTHYLHGADNNAVAADAQVGPPRHFQWLAGPKWSRHHDHMSSMNALVTANGRLFYIMDEGPAAAILLPPKWVLTARDAFNGTTLWKRPLADWNTHLWPLKAGPNQLPRRLVARGDRVYVTLGINAPLSALDAATGETLHTYDGTEHTEEVLLSEDTLFLLVGQGANPWTSYRPRFTYVWDNSRRANMDWAWDRQPRRVMAVAPGSGRVLWQGEQRVAPLTLAADGDRVYWHDGEKVIGVRRGTGERLWSSEPIVRKQAFPTGYGPTLVAHQDVVLVSVQANSMTALDAATGRTLWSAPHHRGGHASPDDLLVIRGLVWSGAIALGADSGVFTGRDLHTGEVKEEFPCDVTTYWFHHRCYRAKAAGRYVLTSRTGIEYVDLDARHWDINHWVRGACLYGVLPANGLTYAPPHPCGCYIESKLHGFNALAADSPSRRLPARVPDDDRLATGPAFHAPAPSPPPAASPGDWPTYRHDPARSGATTGAVPAKLKRAWQTAVGGPLSAPVVAENTVFVAAIDRHAVRALDAGTGQPRWTFVAGGRVDSPPTVLGGRLWFGSADGWVYCLRAADGELAWRFRAAPDERRMMAFEQLESPWPVSGSVLLHRGAVWCVAGRSMFLDGGLRLLQLDAATGRKLSETVLDDRDPDTGEPLQKHIKGLDMPVALPDVLSCDGQRLYMRSQQFDLAGRRLNVAPLDVNEQAGEGVHLFARTGFLDDSWWHRSYWMFGRSVASGWGGWFRAGRLTPSGRLMVCDDSTIYSFARKPEFLANASVYEYYLYAATKAIDPPGMDRVRKAAAHMDASHPKRNASSIDWALRRGYPLSELSAARFKWAVGKPPIQAHAMVLAGSTLFVAGPPDVADENQAFEHPDDPGVKASLAEQAAALEGRRGAQLLAVAASNGTILAACHLDAMPAFDGLAAAQGRLYLSTADGHVLCLSGEGAPLAAVPAAPLAPLDISIRAAPPTPDLASAAAEFTQVLQAKVYQSELGYRLVPAARATGFALRKLETPLEGNATLKCRLQFVNGTGLGCPLQNGFLVFGDSPESGRLVKCGLRLKMGAAVVAEGPLAGGHNAMANLRLEETRTYELTVQWNAAARRVTLRCDNQAVTLTLRHPLESITHIGYCTLNAVTDFGNLHITREPEAAPAPEL
ncbi:MAG: PQQ-binding-like beta-propeller repeat protein [Verrucomicrobia bacterium]|nr:PQQ-binding-like beta-propeller repeat protein [Verrucomicrobiota bacterium]